MELSIFSGILNPRNHRSVDIRLCRTSTWSSNVNEYVEIEDVQKISRLTKSLSRTLQRALSHTEERTVGYPVGSVQTKVSFLSDRNENVFWWAGLSIGNNFFRHGAPNTSNTLNIDVQFNVPIFEFSRRFGGAFLRHRLTGSVVVAHRGIVTRHHGRIPKSVFFAEIAATLREADTSSGTRDFLLIGELNSPTLVNDIETFSSELRRTLRAIEAAGAGDGTEPSEDDPSATRSSLREYFDEFSGQHTLKSRRKTVADCYHGIIVQVLRDALVHEHDYAVLKSKEIDLVAIGVDNAFIFEVKTAADLQSVYTATGQLTIHAPKVAQLMDETPLIRVIVLPERPTAALCNILTGNLNIRILTFDRSARGHISINELNNLMRR